MNHLDRARELVNMMPEKGDLGYVALSFAQRDAIVAYALAAFEAVERDALERSAMIALRNAARSCTVQYNTCDEAIRRALKPAGTQGEKT